MDIEQQRLSEEEVVIDTLYSRAFRNPLMFGYNLGEALGLANTGIFERGLGKIPADKQDEYVKGIAHGVAIKDLGTNGVIVATDERVKGLVFAQADLAYKYLRGILSFKELIS